MVSLEKLLAYAVTVSCAAAAAYAPTARAADDAFAPCTEDAMLVFDASGSMAGNGWGYGSENPSAISRMDRCVSRSPRSCRASRACAASD